MERVNSAPPQGLESRVLLLAPSGRDNELVARQLRQRGIRVDVFSTLSDLAEDVTKGAGVLFIAEEALLGSGREVLARLLKEQPAWSDLPLILMTRSGETSGCSRHMFEASGNITLLERPVRLLTLFSVVASAVRSRERQYQVRVLLEQTRRAVHERDQFLAMLGHELRNPLAAMVNAIEVLRGFGCNDPELTDEQLGILSRQASHMSRLVDDLLDVARVTSGKIVLQPERIDLRELAAKTLSAMKLAIGPQRHEITFETPSLPVMVDVDPVRMEQVLMNLLTNAVKYTREGGRISLSVSDGEEAVVRVRDSGDGIPKDMLQRIFEPFAQVTPSIARSRGGLGMGLAVVRALVKMHGGVVTAQSDGAGCGTEFMIRLPLAKRALAKSAQVESPPPAKPCRILLVEDHTDSRLALTRLLRLYGHEVQTAASGPEGLEKALSWNPEVVLLDIGLPGLDGYEVAARIRKKCPDKIFLVALTGYGQAADREKALAAGFDVHLNKPIAPGQLAEVLARQGCTMPNRSSLIEA